MRLVDNTRFMGLAPIKAAFPKKAVCPNQEPDYQPDADWRRSW